MRAMEPADKGKKAMKALKPEEAVLDSQDVNGSAASAEIAGESRTTPAPAAHDPLDETQLVKDICGEAYSQLKMFHVKLSREGELRGLIGPLEISRLWERHILNSAALVPFMRDYEERERKSGHGKDMFEIADVGSGAGFPGIVLATLLPHDHFTLIEPMERRVEWLSEVCDELQLTNVSIERSRAEEIANRESFDIVTCRAVARLTKLVPWVMPLLRSHGELIALKGQSAPAEVAKAAKEIKKVHGMNPQVHTAAVAEGLEPTHVVTIEKK